MTFKHFMREEIQDASQLPPAFDLFEAFAKVSLKRVPLADAVSQPFTLDLPAVCTHVESIDGTLSPLMLCIPPTSVNSAGQRSGLSALKSVLLFCSFSISTWRVFVANTADIPFRESALFLQKNTAYIFHYLLLKDFTLVLDLFFSCWLF